MTATTTSRFEVARYRPDRDTEPQLAGVRRPAAQGVDGPRRAQPRQGRGRHHLSFRWSCRMGICGSCGMNVNGEPKLTCATFLSDYAPGPDPGRAAGQLPGGPRPRRRHQRLHGEAAAGQAVDHPRRGAVRRSTASTSRRPRSSTPTSSSACASTACSATPPARSTASNPTFIGPAAIALAERYDLDSRDHGARERLDVLIEHEGVWGCTFVGECTRVCPKHVDPAGAIQRYKLKAAQESVKAFLLPRGCADDAPPMSTEADEDLRYHRRVPVLWWVGSGRYFVFVMRELSSIFVAGSCSTCCCSSAPSAAARRRTTTSSTGRASPWWSCSTWSRSPSSSCTRSPGSALTPKAMVLDLGGRRGAAGGDHRRAVRRPGRSSPPSSFWLVTR